MQFAVPCIKSAKDTYVFPAQCRLAVLTVDICYSMQACEQNSLLCWATPDVHPDQGAMGLPCGKESREKRDKQRQGDGSLKISVVQVAQVVQLGVMCDVLRVSHCLTPTLTVHADRPLGCRFKQPNFHTQLITIELLGTG